MKENEVILEFHEVIVTLLLQHEKLEENEKLEEIRTHRGGRKFLMTTNYDYPLLVLLSRDSLCLKKWPECGDVNIISDTY